MTGPHAGAASDDARELARWTHAWAAAAVLTLAQMDAVWDDADPADSVGARDALALVLVDAVRNTYRGALNVLGQRDAAVAAFDTAVPDLKDLRDRFEHFDAYLGGTGHTQAERRGPPLDAGGATRLSISASSGGGPEGHTIRVDVAERNGEQSYRLESRTAVRSAQRLARATIERAGLDDDRHAARCQHCLY